MNPDEHLSELRKLVARLLHERDHGKSSTFADVARSLELFQAFDQWISCGGSFPQVWVGADNPDYNTFTASRSEFSRLLNDYAQLLAQVTSTQASNTALVEENRRLKEHVRALQLGIQET